MPARSGTQPLAHQQLSQIPSHSEKAATPAAFTNYAAVQDYLYSLKAKGGKYGIDRMKAFSAALGHPELRVPTIHVTGTNGKGSTSAMVDTILREAGLRCGLYTSPHLVRLGERVQVDRTILSEAELLAYTNELRPIAEKVGLEGDDMHPTFFEFMTAMAFLQFARSKCDAAVIEVGMGGELDATNVVLPEVSVITSISLDHCEFLGNTVEQIAATKAGIIKPGRPVVVGRVPPGAEKVIREKARDCGSEVFSVRDHYGENLAAYPLTNLEGDFQRWNAATATLVVRALQLGRTINEETIATALRKVRWPGRWQRGLVGKRPIIFDASHNPEGAEMLDGNLRHLISENGRPPVVVTGVLGSQRAEAILSTLCRQVQDIHLVVPQQARACSFEQLESLIPASYRGRLHRASVEKLFPAPGLCTIGGPDDTILVTGSIYLLGEVLARLEPERGPGEGRLQDF